MSNLYKLQSPYVQAVSQVDVGPYIAIPRVLFQHPRFRKPNGKPHRLAIEVFAALLSWYRPVWVTHTDPETGREAVRVYQRFPGHMLRINYAAWARWLYGDETVTGPVKRAVAFLKRQGLIRFELRPRQGPDGRLMDNVPYIAPDPEALSTIFALEQFAAPPADLFEPGTSQGQAAPGAPQGQAEPGAPQGQAEPGATALPSRAIRRDGASFFAPPSRAKLRDLKQESRKQKSREQEESHPPPRGEGGMGGGGKQTGIENIFRKLGVPQRYRAALAMALKSGRITWADVGAEWARVYAAQGLKRPAAVAAANLVRGDLPEPEWYRRSVPAEVAAILAPVWQSAAPAEAKNDNDQAERMWAELRALQAELLEGAP